MTRARDLADSADKDIAGTITLDAVNASGVITGLTVEATGDTAAGDNAAMGYTAAEGLILTGQGSTGDITIKNDADAVVLQVPTGTTNVNVIGSIDVATNAVIDGTGLVTGVLTANGGAVFNEGSADLDFRVESNGNTHMLFVDGGSDHVNIGTDTDYGGRLNIKTGDNSTNLVLVSTDADGSVGPVLDLYRNSGSPVDGDLNGRILFTGENDNGEKVEYTRISSYIGDASDGTEDGNLYIQRLVAGAQNSIVSLTNTETVFNDGSLDLDFRVESNGNANALFVDGGGTDVGINTVPSNPGWSTNVHVAGAGNGAGIQFTDSTSGSGNDDGLSIASYQGSAYVINRENNNMHFSTNATVRMTISGPGLITSVSLGNNNTRFGVNAGALYQSGGNNNTVYGNEAGNDITTGDENAYFGYLAGDDSSTGSQNVAIGSQAMSAGSSLSDNTCVGRSAGESLNNGSNTAIGTNALFAGSNTAGVVAVGSQALKNHEVGSGALTGNVAVGYRAAFEMTTGVSNVYMGADCGFNNLSGDSNVFIGFQSGSGASSAKLTGGENVGIGRNTLVAIQADSNRNTCVGTYAGDTITTADDSVCIGYNVDTSAASVGNQIIVGVNRPGAGSNTVKFGVSGGTATLDLNGSDTSWAAASDARLKKDVEDSTAGLSFIKDLRPITFKWKAKNEVADTLYEYDADSSDPVYGSGQTQHGFLAQEVKTVIDAHSELKNGFTMWRQDPTGTQELAPSAVVPMLVKAIQELEARIAVLEG
jgi:hypothetical protein